LRVHGRVPEAIDVLRAPAATGDWYAMYDLADARRLRLSGRPNPSPNNNSMERGGTGWNGATATDVPT